MVGLCAGALVGGGGDHRLGLVLVLGGHWLGSVLVLAGGGVNGWALCWCYGGGVTGWALCRWVGGYFRLLGCLIFFCLLSNYFHLLCTWFRLLFEVEAMHPPHS